MLAQSFGPAMVYVGFAAAAFAGNVLMGAACVAPHYPLLLAGRTLTGFAYEALDLMPMGLLAPRFASSWALLVGVINGVNRLGSVLSFLLEPVLLRTRGGIAAALALPALLGASILPSALAVWRLDARLRRRRVGALHGALPEKLASLLHVFGHCVHRVSALAHQCTSCRTLSVSLRRVPARSAHVRMRTCLKGIKHGLTVAWCAVQSLK